ncbi:MAG: hypothetical protein ACQERN_10640, partial [Thermodesulfobacteriota bacterium]
YGMKPADEDRHQYTFDGKININTAEMPVIAALMPVGQEFAAEEIVAYREEKANEQYIHDLSDREWYKEVPGAGDIEIDSDVITTTSDLFRVRCEARLNDAAMSATVVLKREKNEETGKWQCKVLNWTNN